MESTKVYRALSLDLGQTVLWDTAQQAARHTESRARTLSAVLIGPAGRRVSPAEIAAAERAMRAELQAARRGYGTVSTKHRVEDIVRRLRARLSVPIDEAVSRVALSGLDSDPPHLNPQARRLVKSLNQRNLPVIAISNTQRTGEAWAAYLRSTGLALEFVITSSDYETAKPDPRLFRAAADRLGRSPGEVLHVGDRWSTDVVGALSVGMGAGLYRGLWPRSWDPEEEPPSDPGGHTEVYRWDDLAKAEALLESASDK